MKKEYSFSEIKDMFYVEGGTLASKRINKHLHMFLNIDGIKIINNSLHGNCKNRTISYEKTKELILAQICFERYILNNGRFIRPVLLNMNNPIVKEIVRTFCSVLNIINNFAIVRKEFDKFNGTYLYQIVRRVNLLNDVKESITQDNKTVYNFNDQPKTKKEVKITKQESEKSIVDRLAKERSLERKNKELEERISQLEIKVDRVIELVSAVDDKTIIMAKMIRLLNEKDSEAQKLRA